MAKHKKMKGLLTGILGKIGGASIASQGNIAKKQNQRIRKRLMSAVLSYLGLTLAAVPALAESCNVKYTVGIWDFLADKSRWSFNSDGSINCTGSCYTKRIVAGKEADLGRPMGWTIGNNAIAPRGQYNFTLYWTKRGATHRTV